MEYVPTTNYRNRNAPGSIKIFSGGNSISIRSVMAMT